jgi:hypothetical protein
MARAHAMQELSRRRTYGGAASGRCVTDGGLAGPNMRLLDEVFDPPGPARRAYGRIERLLAPARLADGGRRKARSRSSGRSSPACRSVRTAALTAGINWSPLARIVEARRRALHRADPWPDIAARKPVGGADACKCVIRNLAPQLAIMVEAPPMPHAPLVRLAFCSAAMP